MLFCQRAWEQAGLPAGRQVLPCSNPHLYKACKIKKRLTVLFYFTFSWLRTMFELVQ